MDKYCYEKPFEIKYRESDFNDFLKPSGALSFMEEVAGYSAEELGFGYNGYLKNKGYAFMISSVAFTVRKQIATGQTVNVKTWPTPPSYVVFGREYEFLSATGETLLSASSRWCLIDLKTNKILSSKVLEDQDYSKYHTEKALEVERWKIPVFPKEEGVEKYNVLVANSEYDHNMHVNNTRYADFCMNCFSVAYLKQHSVKRFAVSYIKQCKEGDFLSFYLKEDGDCKYVQGYNQLGELVVQTEIIFEKITENPRA